MMSHSQCEELDYRGSSVSEFLKHNRECARAWPAYDYSRDRDYVPSKLYSTNDNSDNTNDNDNDNDASYPPDVALQEKATDENKDFEFLVPNWLAWTVVVGMIACVIAIAGWINHPQSKTFLGLTTVAVFIVTVSLFYGEYYLNERNN